EFWVLVELSPRGRDETVHSEKVVDVAVGVDRRAPLHGAEHSDRCHEQCHQPDAEELSTALLLTTLCHSDPRFALQRFLHFAIALGDTGIEERPFRSRELQRRRSGPSFYLFEEAA